MELIVLLRPGWDHVPAQAIVQGKVRFHAPAVLREETGVLVAIVETAGVALVVAAGDAEEEVGHIGARLGSLKYESTIKNGIGISVDLIEMEFAAQFESVFADDAREVVHPLVGIVDLGQSCNVLAEGEVVEGNVFDTFNGRRKRNDAGCSVGVDKTLGGEALTYAANRTACLVGVAHEAEMKFVDRIGTERPSDGQTE